MSDSGSQLRNDVPILVAVDFSATAEAALLFAADLADSIQAPLYILHVVHDPGDAPGYYVLPDRDKQLRSMEDVGAIMLAEFVARVRTEHPELDSLESAEVTHVVGIPVPRIMEIVDRIKPRMLVMGNTGRTRLSRMMLGSKAGQAVHICPVPITIVRLDEDKP